jgi:hypothetical protein
VFSRRLSDATSSVFTIFPQQVLHKAVVVMLANQQRTTCNQRACSTHHLPGFILEDVNNLPATELALLYHFARNTDLLGGKADWESYKGAV